MPILKRRPFSGSSDRLMLKVYDNSACEACVRNFAKVLLDMLFKSSFGSLCRDSETTSSGARENLLDGRKLLPFQNLLLLLFSFTVTEKFLSICFR